MGCGGMCERLEGLCAFSALRAAFLLPWLLISEGERALNASMFYASRFVR